jgi:ABC-type glutathione transport system ATPase component
VGESGSGKSTLARLVMALDTPTSGAVHLLGRDLHRLPAAELRHARRDFQMVFQDPYGSLDPRHTVQRIVTEPLQAQGATSRAEQREQAAQVLRRWACAAPTWTNTRTSFRAASASALRLRAHSSPAPASSWPTSP